MLLMRRTYPPGRRDGMGALASRSVLTIPTGQEGRACLSSLRSKATHMMRVSEAIALALRVRPRWVQRQQGVRPGDRILSVDGHPVTGVPVDEVKTLLRGEPGTSVTLALQRDGALEKRLDIEVPRKEVR
eukprot:scaffold179457_cov28-Tisochrysis_lutea.AAC.2